jgi:hypothetical protein
MTVYVSIALFFYKPNSFTTGGSKSIIFIEITILAIIFRIYFRFLKDNAEVLEELASKISLEYKTKNDGCGPEMQNRAAGSEETPHLFNKTCCLKMNLLLRLSHASTAFDDSGNLMHDTSLFFFLLIIPFSRRTQESRQQIRIIRCFDYNRRCD